VRWVVGTVVLAVNPLPPSAIATLVGLGEQKVIDLLRLIHSLQKLPDDPNSPVLPFHKSFPDFITDPLRCPNERFHIPPRTGHLKLALSCLKLMNGSLEQNFLSLPDYSLNSEVEDLQTRIKDRISVALEYACRSWHSHLIETMGDVTSIVPALRSFLQESFLAWLEVLSVIGAARDAIIALEDLITWLQEVSCISTPPDLIIREIMLTHAPNQVARDHQLLETARDCFHFATTFFELIGASATHIYHSALELSPLSSIVRKFYYYQRPHPSPRVVIGVPDSWNPGTPISAKRSYYLSSTWSPCGQFIATMTKEAVETRDALTLELVSTLQSTKATTTFRPGLAYSPDGRSVVGCSDTAIVIWDTQTGGVVKEIGCEITRDGLEPVWSLDGKTIGTLSPRVLETITVHTYDIASGRALSLGTLQSRDKPYLWAHDKSFRIATTMAWDRKGWKINIFEVGSALTKIESFPFQLDYHFVTFSPTTLRISVSVAGDHNDGRELVVLDVRNSEALLRETGSYAWVSFSPDGSVLAGFSGEDLHIWMCNSGRYSRWRQFKRAPTTLQFSQTLSLILGDAGPLLHVLHLDHSPAALSSEPIVTRRNEPRDAYSAHGTYIATARRGGKVITVTNLRAQNPSPSQFIDTDFEILEIVLTGNVLLVKGSDIAVAWLLTEEGVVDGSLGNKRAGRNDSLWAMKPQDLPSRDPNPSFWARLLQREHETGRDSDERASFSVGDGIANVRLCNAVRHYYTGTGQILKPEEEPPHSKRTWYRFHNPRRDDCDLYHRDTHKHHNLPEYDWQVSRTTLQEGWVKDPEGRRRLWLHARWRLPGNDVDWLYDTTTLRLKSSSELVVIKF